MTTKVWEICVIWKDGSTDWIASKDFKQSYPIELDYFAHLYGINEEATFVWCILYLKRKKKEIIS